MLRRRLEMIVPLSSTLLFSITVIALKGEKKKYDRHSRLHSWKTEILILRLVDSRTEAFAYAMLAYWMTCKTAIPAKPCSAVISSYVQQPWFKYMNA